MEVLLLIGAFQAFFFAILVLSKKGKSISDKILAFWLLLFAVHLSFVYYSFIKGSVFYIEYGYIPSGMMVAYYSLMYVYTQSLIEKENVFKIKWLLHFIPVIIVYIGIIPIALLPYKEKVDIVTQLTTNFNVNLILGLIILFTTGYIVSILLLLKKHKNAIRKIFSYEENINLNWLKILAFLLILLWIVMSSLIAYFYYLGKSTTIMLPEEHMLVDSQGQIAFVIFVLLLGFFGIKQQVIYIAPSEKKEAIVSISKRVKINTQYKKSGLRKEDAQNHLKELLHLMEKEKLYLNGQLSLKEVASQLGISSNHLSQVINENLEKNFFDFVNTYRIDFVRKKMLDPANKKYTVLALAYDAGFNSKSSFNAIFKKNEGLTPTEFLKRHHS